MSGALGLAGTVELKDLSIASKMDLGHVVAVSLDDRPLADSGKILLQVMSEEKNSGFTTEAAGPVKRIVSIGQDPWMVREFEGVVRFKRADATKIRAIPLDANGDPVGVPVAATEIKLKPEILYYLVTP